MIGTDLNLDLPSLSDPLATAIAKLVTALEAVEDSLAQKATPAGLSITSALSLGGNALTEVTSVQLAEGNAPSAAGSIYYAGGSFYGIDEIGIIKLTNNGVVNVLGSGGIVGDYGSPGVGASVYYDDASGEYRFTSDPGVWGDLVADDLVLKGTNGSVRFDVHTDVASARTIVLHNLPVSGVVGLVFDASDNGLKSASTTRETETHLVTKVEASSDYAHTAAFSAVQGFSPSCRLLSCGINSGDFRSLDTNAINWEWQGPLIEGLRAGDRVLTYSVRVTTALAGTINLNLFTFGAAGSVLLDTYTFNPGTTAGLYTRTVAAPAALTTGVGHFFTMDGATSGLRFNAIRFTWDHPA